MKRCRRLRGPQELGCERDEKPDPKNQHGPDSSPPKRRQHVLFLKDQTEPSEPHPTQGRHSSPRVQARSVPARGQDPRIPSEPQEQQQKGLTAEGDIAQVTPPLPKDLPDLPHLSQRIGAYGRKRLQLCCQTVACGVEHQAGTAVNYCSSDTCIGCKQLVDAVRQQQHQQSESCPAKHTVNGADHQMQGVQLQPQAGQCETAQYQNCLPSDAQLSIKGLAAEQEEDRSNSPKPSGQNRRLLPEPAIAHEPVLNPPQPSSHPPQRTGAGWRGRPHIWHEVQL